jgi:uncharacterized membrane protein
VLDPQADAEAHKGMAVLAYILFFVPLIAGEHKKSPFVRFHTNQGTVLFLSCVAFGVVYGILTAILTAVFLTSPGTWGLWGVITTVMGLVWLVPATWCVIGIIHAATGKLKALPGIGRLTIIK